jgi:hypothetical protein
MSPEQIVERIMTQHWDMAACRCWVCHEGRLAGLRPRPQYLWRGPNDQYARVRVPEPEIKR